MSSTVEQVKARLTIVDVVSSYLNLERAGASYRARCPFHNEKTPSFYVSPIRETYHCFGCDRGGDIFTFVEEIEGLDFLGALKILAGRAGVPLEPVNRAKADAKERLHEVMEAAVTYFTATLAKSSQAKMYLLERGLNKKTITDFRLGFASSDWRGLSDYLLGRNFTERDLDQSGLVIRARQSRRLFDRFRNRIMFPINDGAGRPIAFSGRLFETAVSVNEAKEAKYINSPDTLLYDKSRALYLFDHAKLAIRRADRCVLVEGQFDALLSQQVGVIETVAVSGTALSANHLEVIRRLTNKLIMAFDGDAAGVKASNRAITLALERGFEVRVAILPQGQDPAEVIHKSETAWGGILSHTLHVIDFLLETIKRHNLSRRELAHQIELEVYSYLVALANPIDQAYFIRNIAELTGLPETVIREGVNRSKSLKSETPEQIIDTKMLPRTRRERLEELILGFIVWQDNTADLAIRALVGKHWGDDFLARRQAESRGRESEQALMAEITYTGAGNPATILEGVLGEWQIEVWREELADTVQKLKLLDSKVEAGIVGQYLERCQELSQKINNKL